ncbi:MAG: response regulator transcription factor [Solirubrobacteraceae bacterium]
MVARRRRLRLLIADDDPVTRALLVRSLGFAFQIVGEAGDATEAVELARSHRPDAALVDVNMPEGGARTAVPGILAVAPATAIVVLSTDEADAVVRELLIAGAVAYMFKGTDPRELAEAIRRAITVRTSTSY